MRHYDTNMTIRMSKAEVCVIKQYAAAIGRTAGSLMREMILTAAARHEATRSNEVNLYEAEHEETETNVSN
jgi:hypothetical protein